MLKTILVAVDGSPPAGRALEFAGELAAHGDAELVLLHVMARIGSSRIPPELHELARVEHIEVTETEMLRRIGDEILEAAAERARKAGARRLRTVVSVGQPAEAIVAHARAEHVQLIVMGRRGLGTMSELLVGSVSHKVTHLASCACLTVP